jgi:3-oxoacyl-[acyl-carrier protein] reductase
LKLKFVKLAPPSPSTPLALFMTDQLLQFSQNPTARSLLQSLGLPTPVDLSRAKGGYAEKPLEKVVFEAIGKANTTVQSLLKDAGADMLPVTGLADSGKHSKAAAVVFDALNLTDASGLKALYDCFHALTAKIAPQGRVVVLAPLPEQASNPIAAALARGLEGFVRSLAKELGKRAANANLIYVEKGAEDRLAAPLRFFLSAHSVYVDGQALRVTNATAAPAALPFSQSLAGKVALVTGAARGIGAATAKRLADEGARVILLDIPADIETLTATAHSVGGLPLPLDITDPKAADTLVEFAQSQFGGLDVVVHNAGVTRDKTIAKMPEHHWQMVMNINLNAILAIDQKLLETNTLRNEGRVVVLSSIGGIAGNVGQTNYAFTKAALIGYVAAQAPLVADKGITFNAVAPGFIETRMTAAMPVMIREGGRRMNALSQGGQPQDVAEAITFFATPSAYGLTGQVLRCCGQSLIGA